VIWLWCDLPNGLSSNIAQQSSSISTHNSIAWHQGSFLYVRPLKKPKWNSVEANHFNYAQLFPKSSFMQAWHDLKAQVADFMDHLCLDPSTTMAEAEAELAMAEETQAATAIPSGGV
jgi:hypothetical protein